ncbi:MAG: hypothetical protein COW03_02480 [Cytophagales bacterium CG12_big_fil_rev_8_21_14_0_65_40_12]|nr:MAG: hypothetical protein COW03_02480 [Cytophagales bacterium CG12_big_fil_rev_8_21_14_0_65_40_12]PIW03411.1 MAG: hypothetical protein COW40_14725 [Cytophagales bacterium CG17_big_fil_post_rev_8_21_14_2_50_40_13]
MCLGIDHRHMQRLFLISLLVFVIIPEAAIANHSAISSSSVISKSGSIGGGLLLSKPKDEYALFVSVQNGNWDDPNTWGGVDIPGLNDDVRIYHTVQATGNFKVFDVNTVLIVATNNGFTSELRITGGATLNAQSIQVSSSDPDQDGLLRLTGNMLPGTLNVSGNLSFDRGLGANSGRIRMEISGNSTAHIGGDLKFAYNDPNATESVAEVFVQDNGVLTVDGTLEFTVLGGGRASLTIQENASATVGRIIFDLEGDSSPLHDAHISLLLDGNGQLNVLADLVLTSNTSLNNTIYGNDITITLNGTAAYMGVQGNVVFTNNGDVPFAKNIILNLFLESIFEVQGNFTAINASATPQNIAAPDVDINLFDNSQIIIFGTFRLEQQTPNVNVLEVTVNDNAQLLAEGNIEMSSETTLGCRISLLDNSRLEMAGDLVLQNASIAAAVSSVGNATIEYRGLTTQTIRIPKYVNLELNNTSNILNHAYEMVSDISVSNVISFFEGIVLAGDFKVTLFDGGTVAGTPNDGRHVEGYFEKAGFSDFEFPIGANGVYRPYYAENINPLPGSPSIEVKYFNKNPSSVCVCDETLKEPSLFKVSQKEVWSVATNDIGNFRPRLSWADISDVSSVLLERLDLVVAIWGGLIFNEWLDGGQGAIVDNGEFDGSVLGSVFTPVVVGNSTFMTFGSTERGNPLPVSLLYFKEKESFQEILLEWATVSEESNDYFEIQRSFEGLNNFKTIGIVNGHGSVDTLRTYTFHDKSTPNLIEAKQFGLAYYRLKQVDFSGTYTFSEVIRVNLLGKLAIEANTPKIKILPNPIERGNPNIQLVSSISNIGPFDTLNAVLLDPGGNQILTFKGTQKQVENELSKAIQKVRMGIYFLLINTIEHNTKIKIIII